MASETPAKWEADPDGSCVAIMPLNPETMERDGQNVPDLAAMVRAADKDGLDICEYCQHPYMCRDCIVKEWKEGSGGG